MSTLPFPLNISVLTSSDESRKKLNNISCVFEYDVGAPIAASIVCPFLDWVEGNINPEEYIDGEGFKSFNVVVDYGDTIKKYRADSADISRQMKLMLIRFCEEANLKAEFDDDHKDCLRKVSKNRIYKLLKRLNSFLKRCDYKMVFEYDFEGYSEEKSEVGDWIFDKCNDADYILLDVGEDSNILIAETGSNNDAEGVGDLTKLVYQEALLEKMINEVCIYAE